MVTPSGAVEAEREVGIGIGELEPMPNAEEPEPSTAGVDTPAPEATPEGAIAAAPAAAAAGDVTPVGEAVKPDAAPGPDMVATWQELANLRQRVTEQEGRERLANDNARLTQYKAGLEAKGHDPEVVQELVARASENLSLGRQREADQVRAQQNLVVERNNARARILVIRKLSQDFGVSIDTLLAIDTDDPKDLLAAAELYQAKAELKKYQEAAVKPQRLTGVVSGAGRSTSKAALEDRYINGESERMTKAELKVLFPDRY